MKIIESHTIKDLQSPIRLNTFCENSIDFFKSRKSVKKAIKKGEVLLNNTPVHGGTWLKVNDCIDIVNLESKPPKLYKKEIQVVYEDNYLAILNKPAGLTVSGNKFKTVFNALSFNIDFSTEKDALEWPLPVHRLDNQTSGLLIIAKTKIARIELGRIFEKKEIFKTYHALVMGKVSENTQITFPIENKVAITDIEVVKYSKSLMNDYLTLLKVKPQTGRTHQIRIHLSTLGFPILGDKLYAKETIKHKGLFLTATALNFKHPITQEIIDINIPIPTKFDKRMENENRRWEKYKQ